MLSAQPSTHALGAAPFYSLDVPFVAAPPSPPAPSPPVLAKLDFAHPCGLHGSPTRLSHALCATEAIVQPLPSLLLVIVAIVGGARALLCATPLPPPKQLYRRDKSLHIGGLVFAVLGAVAALASVALPLLLPADWPDDDAGGVLPVAWVLSPLIEFVAACVAAVILAHTRESPRPRARSGWRTVVGVAALLQAVALIVVMMLTVEAASSFVLILTLARVGTCCALTLTTLWPNRARASVGSAEDGGWSSPDEMGAGGSSPHTPSLAPPMAAALLRQVENDANEAAATRRHHRDVWAEWLTLSSAQQHMGMNAARPSSSLPINTTNGSTVSSNLDAHSPRITHDSDQRDSGIPYTIGMDSNSASASGSLHPSCSPSPHVSRAPTQIGAGSGAASPERAAKGEVLPPSMGASGAAAPLPLANGGGDTGTGGGAVLRQAAGAGASTSLLGGVGSWRSAAGGNGDGLVQHSWDARESPDVVASAAMTWPPPSGRGQPATPFGTATAGGAAAACAAAPVASLRGHRRAPSNPFEAPLLAGGGHLDGGLPGGPSNPFDAPAANGHGAAGAPSKPPHQRTLSNGSSFGLAPLGGGSPSASDGDQTSSTSSQLLLGAGVPGGGGGLAGAGYAYSDGHGSGSTTARSTATRPTAEGLREDSFGFGPPSASEWGANGGHVASAAYTTNSGEERWTEPLVEVEILGHMWVPDVDNPEKGDMHLEYMLKTVGDEQFAGARLVQRRYRDFERLAAALAPLGRRTNTTVPPLPSNLTFGRKLSTEFAEQRQAALQTWLTRIVARPPLWSDALRLFLGLAEDDLADEDAGTPGGAAHAGAGAGVGGALVLADGGRESGAAHEDLMANLRWIAQRALQPGCGVPMDGSSSSGSGGGSGVAGGKGSFRASTLVKWLATQALVTSREQAVPLGEALRREGFITAVSPPDTLRFADDAALYKFVEPSPA